MKKLVGPQDKNKLCWYEPCASDEEAVNLLFGLQGRYMKHAVNWTEQITHGRKVVMNTAACDSKVLRHHVSLRHKTYRMNNSNPLDVLERVLLEHEPRNGTWIDTVGLLPRTRMLTSTCLTPVMNHLRPDITILRCYPYPCTPENGAVI